MQNTIVFSDIDGTLLSSDLTITPQTLRAIRQLQARQIPFVIISARSPSGILSHSDRARLQLPHRGLQRRAGAG